MKMYLVIGDWSKDGHNQYEKILMESNKSVEEIQQAYKDSCKLTGLSFNNSNTDYTGLNLPWNHPEAKDRRIATEYEESTISILAEEILLKHGINIWEGLDKNNFEEDELYFIDDVDDFVSLWIKFVKLSLPDLELEVAEEVNDIPCINGFWNKELNEQFGYGLFN